MADPDTHDLLPDAILRLPVPAIRSGETRMNDAQACKRLVQQLLLEDQPRSWRRAVAKGCYDRNSPFSRVLPGFNWTCNVNFGQMEGLLDTARIPYYALFSGAPTYCSFKTNYQPENPDRAKWEEKIAEKWTDLLNRWKQFRWHNRAKEFEMLFEGWGPIVFESPTDWRFTSIPARCIKVPKGSYSVLDDRLPFLVVMRDYRVHELWDKISDEGAADAAGWNVPEVKYAIQHACYNSPNGLPPAGQDNWEFWQQRLRNFDLAVSYSDSDVIRCGMVFLKEYGKDGEPGKISVFIVTVSDMTAPMRDNDQDPKPNAGYLYKQVGQYNSYQEAINVYFQNTGDGTWHSVVGMGLKSVKHIDIENRLLCQTVNLAFLSATPIFIPGTNQDKDGLQLMVMGPIAMAKPGTEIAQTRFGADIQGPLSVNRVLENNLAQNIGHYAQRSMAREDGRGEQPTATQVELQASKETALTTAQIDSYYDEMDITYEEMFRRVMKEPDKEARRFVAECLEAGVPREALDKMCYVKANRLSGYPSPENRRRQAREGMGVIGMLPQSGKRNMLNEWICAFYGPDKIAVFNPELPEPDVDAALAQLENGILVQGIEPITPPEVNNATHLQIHLEFAAEKMDPLRTAMEEEGQLDPAALEEAYQYISALGPHCQAHLDALKEDPSADSLYEQFKAALGNVASFHGKLYNAIRQARRDAQQAALEAQNANALGVMDQAKLQSMQAEVQRDNLKAASDIQIKRWKAEQGQQLKTWKTGQDTRLKAAQTAADTQIKRSAAKANGSSDK